MEKLGLVFKEASKSIIKDNLASAQGVFIIGYSKLSSPDITSIRQSLKVSQAKLFVAKNTVARRALKDARLDGLLNLIEGPCGFVFSKEEPVAVSRSLWDFFKSHEQLKLLGGALKDKVIKKSDIEALAKLPSKEILRLKLVMALNSPISKFACVLSQTLKKFVYCLEQIKEKKNKDQGGKNG